MTSLQNQLQNALTTRLNLQIMLSSFPIVEEWMDEKLDDWLQSVPVPPEMPQGSELDLRVRMASDLSALSWAAAGPPSAMIPKLTKYFTDLGVSETDLDLINQVGGALEPDTMGSWIGVQGKQLVNGWQFCQRQSFDDLAAHLSDDAAKAKLVAWLSQCGITEFSRFAQAIGDFPYSLFEFPLPTQAGPDHMASVRSAFSDLLEEPIEEALRQVLEPRLSSQCTIRVILQAHSVVAVGVISERMAADDIAAICNTVGVGYSDSLRKLQGVLQSDGPARVAYGRHGKEARVELELKPGEVERAEPRAQTN